MYCVTVHNTRVKKGKTGGQSHLPHTELHVLGDSTSQTFTGISTKKQNRKQNKITPNLNDEHAHFGSHCTNWALFADHSVHLIIQQEKNSICNKAKIILNGYFENDNNFTILKSHQKHFWNVLEWRDSHYACVAD